MKMESTITAPAAGTVERVARAPQGHLEQGDLILVLEHDPVPDLPSEVVRT
jgi:biotin carboxyl carrier protein